VAEKRPGGAGGLGVRPECAGKPRRVATGRRADRATTPAFARPSPRAHTWGPSKAARRLQRFRHADRAGRGASPVAPLRWHAVTRHTVAGGLLPNSHAPRIPRRPSATSASRTLPARTVPRQESFRRAERGV